MEDKVPPKVYSFIAVIGSLYDNHAYVIGNADDIKYIRQYHTDHSSDAYSPESTTEAILIDSPLEIINTLGRKGYYIATFSSGHSNQMKVWILEKEFCFCNCSCHSANIRLSTEDQGIDLRIRKEKYKSWLRHIGPKFGALIINVTTDSSDSGLDTEDYGEMDSLKICDQIN